MLCTHREDLGVLSQGTLALSLIWPWLYMQSLKALVPSLDPDLCNKAKVTITSCLQLPEGVWFTMSEKLCLKWNDFQENVNSAFGNLREDKEFTDVTLAWEDGQQIEAHKVVLAASSPFFQNLLNKNVKKHHHPLIFMKGIKFEDLCAIIDFLCCNTCQL